MKKISFMFAFWFVTLIASSQGIEDLQIIRSSFQNIQNEDDIKNILDFQINETDFDIANVIEAYKGASQSMLANYVFSPLSKLKNFKKGKNRIEASINENKVVENVYIRLMIQLNAPKIVNYDKNIDSDMLFFEQNLVAEPIDLDFKKLMIENLLAVVKEKEHEKALLQIDLSVSN